MSPESPDQAKPGPPAQPTPGPPDQATPDSFAIAAFVSALLVIPVAPIWFGLRARTRIRESAGTRDGMGIATIGIVIGVAETAAAVALLVYFA